MNEKGTLAVVYMIDEPFSLMKPSFKFQGIIIPKTNVRKQKNQKKEEIRR